MSPRGGARKGAGRKPKPKKEKLVSRSVTLRADQAKLLEYVADLWQCSEADALRQIVDDWDRLVPEK